MRSRFGATTTTWTLKKKNSSSENGDANDDDLEWHMKILKELRREREILAFETEQLRKRLEEVCRAAAVIQRSFRRFQQKKKMALMMSRKLGL